MTCLAFSDRKVCNVLFENGYSIAQIKSALKELQQPAEGYYAQHDVNKFISENMPEGA